MQQELLDHLKKITEEEQKILDGSAEVDKELYTSGRDFIVDSRKMLDEGKADHCAYPYPVCSFSCSQT